MSVPIHVRLGPAEADTDRTAAGAPARPPMPSGWRRSACRRARSRLPLHRPQAALARVPRAGRRRRRRASRRCAIAGAYRHSDRQRRGPSSTAREPQGSASATRSGQRAQRRATTCWCGSTWRSPTKTLKLEIEADVDQVIHIDRRIEGDAGALVSAAGICSLPMAATVDDRRDLLGERRRRIVGNHSDATSSVGRRTPRSPISRST